MFPKTAGHLLQGQLIPSVQNVSVEPDLRVDSAAQKQFQVTVYQLPEWGIHVHTAQNSGKSPLGIRHLAFSFLVTIPAESVGAIPPRPTMSGHRRHHLLTPAPVEERDSAPKVWRRPSWWRGRDVGGKTRISESPVFPKTCVAPNPHLKGILAEGFLEIQKKWV
jgi:hypothetical protein